MDKVTVNWIKNSLHLKALIPDNSSEFEEKFKGHFFPFAENHVGQPLPIFLGFRPTAHWMMKRAFLYSRDGRLPLLDCLYRQPEPPSSFKLLFKETLRPWIPKKWAEQHGFFRLKSKNQFGRSRWPKKLILAGVISPYFSTETTIANEYQRLAGLFGEKFESKMEVICFFRTAWQIGYHQTQLKELWSFMQCLNKYFGQGLRFIEHDELRTFAVDSETAYLELNNELAVSDSYVAHWLLSKGAGFINEEDTDDSAHWKYEPLSLYHGVEHRSLAPTDFEFPDSIEIEAMSRITSSSDNFSGCLWQPWIELRYR